MRFEFAEKYRLEKEIFWNDVIFTDESKFNVFCSDGKVRVGRNRVLRLNEKLKKQL